MSLRLSAAAAAVCALISLPTWAATATVNVSIAVEDIVAGLNTFTGGAQDVPPFVGVVSADLAVGDTFDFTIDFVGAQTLTVSNLSSLWVFAYADSSAQTTGTGTLSLLDANGAALHTSDSITTTEGDVHFGQQFVAANFPSLPGSVTFGGLRYVGTVDAYDPVALGDPAVTTRHYNSPAFYFIADGFTASVPEASTWALLAAGLAVLGAVGRRRRAA